MQPVEDALRRIEQTRALNAVIVHNPERSRAEAARATGPLAGVPFSVKDNLTVAGWPLSLGVYENPPVATTTATVVQRLRAAGAVLVAKTNLPPYGGGIEAGKQSFRRPNQPHEHPVRRLPNGRRLVRRRGRRGRGRDLPVRARHGQRRVRPPARPLLRT